MRRALKQFNPDPYPTIAELEMRAQEIWQGLPFGWKGEFDQWKLHSERFGQILTYEGLVMWFRRVQLALCPVAGEGCKVPIATSRFCRFHYEQISGLRT